MATETELKNPIKRGSKEIKKITMQEPTSGTLRGLEVMALVRMDVTQVRTLVPRISNITEAEFDQLGPADIASVCADVASFFMG